MGAAADALAATPSDLAVSALRSLAGNGIPPGAGQWTHALGETRSGSTPASWNTGTRGQCQVTATLPPHGSAPIADVIWSTSGARLAQPVERKALNLVVVGSSPTVGAAAEALAATPSDPAVSALRSLAGNGIPPGAGQWTHALGETRSGSTPASRNTGTRGQCQVTATLPPHGSAPITDVI